MLSLPVFAAYENTHKNTGNAMEDIIAVAETQLGYMEGSIAGTVQGYNDCTKYGQWYGDNMTYMPWCAMFVSWCADQAGIPTTIIPKHANCDVGMDWFIGHGRFAWSSAYGGTRTPQRGDIVYFGAKYTTGYDSTHVGIVYKVDSKKIYVLEGNSSAKVQTVPYDMTSGYILGYGMPDYSLETKDISTGMYETTASVLNFRAEPNSSSEIIGKLYEGTAIKITEIKNQKWGKTTYDGKTGWVSMDYCTPQFTVSYNANGGTNAPASQTGTLLDPPVITKSTPTHTKWSFLGWSTTASGSVQYNPGSVYTGGKSVTLYAVWKKPTYTVSYKANGGSNTPADQTFTEGSSIKISSVIPTKPGCTFMGWSTKWDAEWPDIYPGDTYNKNASCTLFAIWTVTPKNTSVVVGAGGRVNQRISGNTLTLRIIADSGNCISYISVNGKPIAVTSGVTQQTLSLNASGNTVAVTFVRKDGSWINPFKDVSANMWYMEAVEYCYTRGIISGTDSTHFSPHTNVTRAQFIAILGRLHGNVSVSGTVPFTDVSKSGYYYNFLVWAYNNKIVSGTSATKFSPSSALTREQLCTMLYNYTKLKGSVGKFTDAAMKKFPDCTKVSSWAKTGVSWAVHNKYLSGSDGKLLPRNNATRAQTAQIIMQYSKK